MTDLEPSRRNLLAGVAAAGLAVPLVAACGGGGGDTTVTGTAPSSGTSPATGGGAAGAGGGIKTSEIPVGGGKIFAGRQVVVTQPSAGEFKAFSAICTHQGCLVSQVADGTIVCPCHGSMFSIKDGSVEGGMAPTPLPEKTVTVSGDSLIVT